jgi:hypothetical protein
VEEQDWELEVCGVLQGIEAVLVGVDPRVDRTLDGEGKGAW